MPCVLPQIIIHYVSPITTLTNDVLFIKQLVIFSLTLFFFDMMIVGQIGLLMEQGETFVNNKVGYLSVVPQNETT